MLKISEALWKLTRLFTKAKIQLNIAKLLMLKKYVESSWDYFMDVSFFRKFKILNPLKYPVL